MENNQKPIHRPSSMNVEAPGDTPYVPAARGTTQPPEEVQYPDIKDVTLKITPREEWCRTPPKWKEPLKLPVKYIFSTFTRKSHCQGNDQCFAELQYLHYRSTKYGDKPDIIYNFLIGGDGTVYEGRGWTEMVNLPRRYQALQKRCLSIAMMGTFQYRPPSATMKKVQNMLIKYGMDEGYIDKKITHIIA